MNVRIDLISGTEQRTFLTGLYFIYLFIVVMLSSVFNEQPLITLRQTWFIYLRINDPVMIVQDAVMPCDTYSCNFFGAIEQF